VSAPPAPRAKIVDEPDEVIVQPAKFTIQDEPEERVAKVMPVKVEIKDEPPEAGGGNPIPTEKAPLVQYAVNPETRSFGISTTANAGPASNKRITFAEDGSTNSTVVRLDKIVGILGGRGGKWLRTNVPRLEDGIAPTPYAILPSHSTWMVPTGTGGAGVVFHQVLEIVPGQALTAGSGVRRQYDTVVVRWIIHNRDKKDHSTGLRLKLDTLIGGNDGVPFTVPGQTGLVTSFADFRTAKEVPDFVQALEVANLKQPGTVAHMTLKLGSAVEPPDRVSLTAWPGPDPSWNIPVAPMGNDSAAILYWSPKTLKAGDKRVIGFSYGLGNVAYNDKLGLTLGGSFEPGQQFTATAYVENPAQGQTLRLELPAGLKRVEGAETQPVPAAKPGGPALVTWKVEVAEVGSFRLVVHSSTGISQAKTISIVRPDAAPAGKLTLELTGAFDPGKTFDVAAKVDEAAPGQTLTLTLPTGLQVVEGTPAQPVRATAEPVRWKVKVLQSGKFPVRVASSTGIAQTKTITIAEQAAPSANFRIGLEGDFSPGKTFTVKADVTAAQPDQTLALQLPAGLERAGGEPIQPAPAGAGAVR
jgi:hypothetical protein